MMSKIYDKYGPWALIAGGSDGIGLSFAEHLASAGVNLILLARREEALAQAKSTLMSKYSIKVSVHSVDLTAHDLEQQLDSVVGDREVGMLIYNAGAVHGAELFLSSPIEKAKNLVYLNCHGPVLLCHKLGKPMRDRGRGGIILMSSMSGFAGSAYTAVYSATKSFDIIFAEALWAELKPFGVSVLGLVAGATDTPAMARSGIEFGDYKPMTPDEVALEGLENLSKGPVHVAGEGNRARVEVLRGDRVKAIERVSAGAAYMYKKPYPILGGA